MSFLEIRFEWSRQEMAEAQTYVVNPLRYFYNEVEDDMTEYDIEPRLDLGYKRIQCSSLVLPKLKKGGSPIKYLTNGSLVVSRLIKEELANTCADNLGFTPVIHRDQIHRDQRASAEMKRYDSCVGECLHNGNSEAEWFQVISKEACPIETETFDPFNINIFAIADQEPYLHVFPRFFNPLKGTLTYADGAFSSVGFGLKPGGLFTSFTRPLIISKRLYELISPYSFRSVTFDPFV